MAALIQFFLTGGAGNADPNASLGGTRSATQVSGTAMNNLFDDVSPAEATAGDVEYRAIDLYNAGDAEAQAVTVHTDPDTPSPKTEIDLGLEAGTQTVPDENTAPSGVAFAHHTPGAMLSVPNIAAGSAQRLWLRRTVQAGAVNLNNDATAIKVQYA
ncbi:MAG TPA: hypothetical protein PK250_12690 [Syntrophobacter fumaroxidans]|nr:hypothetical protein [Syntrophobacter fumaroxidans]